MTCPMFLLFMREKLAFLQFLTRAGETQKTLESQELLLRLFHGNGHGDGSADHGVVAHADSD